MKQQAYKKAFEKVKSIKWELVLLFLLIAIIGFIQLYSVSSGSIYPWAIKQMIRFFVGIFLIVCVVMIDLKFFMRWAYIFYFMAIILVLTVDFIGLTGMGARRWLSLGIVSIQPSEFMKIALILVLARYWHGVHPEARCSFKHFFISFFIIALPAILVIKQPDFGTGILIITCGFSILFMAGVPWRYFILLVIGIMSSTPFVWVKLHVYQKERILTFFNPMRDAKGAGYHIIQSKIALGSGGLWGKGLLNGTQSHLDFLPEKHTDFIFTMLGEERGFIGGIILIGLYIAVIIIMMRIALNSRSTFGRLLSVGVLMNFFLCVFINMAMVMGLLPIVGIPLPLVSYGGTALLSLMLSFGLILSVDASKGFDFEEGYSNKLFHE